MIDYTEMGLIELSSFSGICAGLNTNLLGILPPQLFDGSCSIGDRLENLHII